MGRASGKIREKKKEESNIGIYIGLRRLVDGSQKGENLYKNVPPVGHEPGTFHTGARHLTYYSKATSISNVVKFCNHQEHMQCDKDSLFCLHEFPFLLTGNFFFAYRNSLFCIQEFSFLLTGISRI